MAFDRNTYFNLTLIFIWLFCISACHFTSQSQTTCWNVCFGQRRCLISCIWYDYIYCMYGERSERRVKAMENSSRLDGGGDKWSFLYIAFLPLIGVPPGEVIWMQIRLEKIRNKHPCKYDMKYKQRNRKDKNNRREWNNSTDKSDCYYYPVLST